MWRTVIYGDVTIFDVLVVIVILIIAILVSKGLTIYLRRTLSERINKDRLLIIIKVIYYSIILITVLSVLPIIGVNLSGLLVVGGIAGVIIGFATQNIIGNLISGFFLMIERPIKIGDQIQIDGVAGFAEDIRIISTTIRTYDGLYVRIPNEKIFTSNITNFVTHAVRRFEYVVGIRYSDDATKAIEIIKQLIDEHPFALHNPAPQAFVDNLGDNSVNIFVRIWAPVTEWYGIKMEMLWKIKMALEESGIEIAFPQRVVWFANELKNV
ncbi:MAG: mechanosensitive ion channel family protein [Thermodesulfobacteriota bacterium]|nr:mechanosensitive ion channel family protein [Thermodesulfobacteriota bacterium]